MRELTRRSSVTPEMLPEQRFPAIEPTRFSLRDAPERERDDLYREFFGRSVMRYDAEPSRDIPLDIDVKLQMLPDLLMVTGKMHGSVNRRTQERVADGLDDFAMAINLGGRYVVSQDRQEIVLDDGEATLFSLGRLCNLMHWPPGDFVALRFPRSQIMPRIAGRGGGARPWPARGAVARHQAGHCRKPRPAGSVGRDDRLSARLHAAFRPAAVRGRRHDIHRIRAGAASRARPPFALRSASWRGEDQHRGL
jgi:hypothetical protein